ncbi:hypothetical protein GIB67_020432 [Kingdonia uniflora]|uniref:Uncharacterized protein n=1 Tax=Kingdonia uniflora TaxID=39325 RepID=A0A7J7LUV6_9MAGN|nr:hypothetical protein GIB67_020432 [Kingdonia uniflora]
MADETVINNSFASLSEDQTVEIEGTKTRDIDLNDSEISEMKSKIDDLEQQKALLIGENQESRVRIRDLSDEIEGLKRVNSSTKEKLGEMQAEIDRAEEHKRALQVISARASELETEVFRLQHELGSLVVENGDAATEIRELQSVIEVLKLENQERGAAVEALESEKVSLLERIERGVVETKERESKSDAVVVVGAEKEKAEIESLKTLKGSLEEALKEMEAKVTRLESDLKDSEKKSTVVMNGSGGLASKRGLKSSKVQWTTVALASTGTVVAMGAMVYINCARRR